MHNISKISIVLRVGVLLALGACATQQPLVTLDPGKGEMAIMVKAGDFEFKPNNIKAYKGAEIVFQIENISGSAHNFTVKDPQGKTLQSMSLPSKEIVRVKISLSETGTYEFYCDKPLHSGLGMKGQIVVVREP